MRHRSHKQSGEKQEQGAGSATRWAVEPTVAVMLLPSDARPTSSSSCMRAAASSSADQAKGRTNNDKGKGGGERMQYVTLECPSIMIKNKHINIQYSFIARRYRHTDPMDSENHQAITCHTEHRGVNGRSPFSSATCCSLGSNRISPSAFN